MSAPERPVVAITGLEGRDNPYPGVAIARALRAARGDSISLVGFAYEPALTGNFREDLFDRVYLTPLPGDPAATLLRRIFEIHEEYPLDVLIPALDSELALFATHRAELAERGIRMVIPSPEAVRSRYKQRLFAWAQRHSIFTPRTEVVTKPESFWEQEAWSLPCYLKGPLADAVRVESVAEAICVYHRLVRRWGALHDSDIQPRVRRSSSASWQCTWGSSPRKSPGKNSAREPPPAVSPGTRYHGR